MKATWPKLRMPELPVKTPMPSTAIRLIRKMVKVRWMAIPAK